MLYTRDAASLNLFEDYYQSYPARETGRVLMIVTNSCVNDSRVIKSAESLVTEGYTVRVLCRAVGNLPDFCQINGVEYVRIPMKFEMYRSILPPDIRNKPSVLSHYNSQPEPDISGFSRFSGNVLFAGAGLLGMLGYSLYLFRRLIRSFIWGCRLPVLLGRKIQKIWRVTVKKVKREVFLVYKRLLRLLVLSRSQGMRTGMPYIRKIRRAILLASRQIQYPFSVAGRIFRRFSARQIKYYSRAAFLLRKRLRRPVVILHSRIKRFLTPYIRRFRRALFILGRNVQRPFNASRRAFRQYSIQHIKRFNRTAFLLGKRLRRPVVILHSRIKRIVTPYIRQFRRTLFILASRVRSPVVALRSRFIRVYVPVARRLNRSFYLYRNKLNILCRKIVRVIYLARVKMRRIYVISRSRVKGTSIRLRRKANRTLFLAKTRTRRLFYLFKNNLRKHYVLSAAKVAQGKSGLRNRVIFIVLDYVRKIRKPLGNLGVKVLADVTVTREIIDFRPDIIHAHDLATLPVSVKTAGLIGADVVYDSHELELHRNGLQPLDRLFVYCLERNHLRYVNAVITVCDSISDYLAKKYRITPPAVIMNAPEIVGVEYIGPTLRDVMNLPDEIPLAVYVGKITFGRGLDELVQAMQYTREFHVALLGPSVVSIEAQLLKKAVELGVRNRLHIVPSVEPKIVMEYIKSADIGVIPIQDVCLSYRYCMPNKLFEMAFSGIPACVSQLTEMQAFINREHVGITMDQTDPKDIARAMKELYARKSEFIVDPYRGRELYLKYSWETQARKLKALYKDVLLPHYNIPAIAAV